MSNRPVTSREYKLMLNVDRFVDRKEGCDAVLALTEHLLSGVQNIASVERQNDSEKVRKTSYLDTADMALCQRSLAVRRREESEGKTQLNLKFRSPDRYLSAANEVLQTLPAAELKPNSKFEEDVIPPFASRFSRSLTINTDRAVNITTIRDATGYFPGLATLDLDTTPLHTVNGFEATEVERRLCTFRFADGPKVKASLSFWYMTHQATGWPLVAEFSFDYDAEELKNRKGKPELETFHGQTVEDTNRLFLALQRQAGWVNSNMTTKTAYALAAS